MRIKTVKLRDHDMCVVPHKGKYDISSSHVFMLGDAVKLLEKANEHIAGYADLISFGDTHRELRQWVDELQQFADKRRDHFTKGDDYLS